MHIDLKCWNNWLLKHQICQDYPLQNCQLYCTFLCRNGPNHWRDTDLPTDILDWYCKVNGLKEPVRTSNGLIYNYEEYTIDHTGTDK